MTRLGPHEMSEILTVQAGEMHRIWRLARHSIQPDMLPGLADGPMAAFFAALAPALDRGAGPAEVAGKLQGLLRVPPGGADAALIEEWDVARQVLRAACESLGASEPVAAWLEEAACAAREAALSTARGLPSPAPGLTRLTVFSGLSFRARTV